MLQAGSDVIMAVTIKNDTFFCVICVMTPRSPIEFHRRFGRPSIFMDKGLCFPMLLAGYFFDFHFDLEDRYILFFQKLCEPLPEYTALRQSQGQSYFMTACLLPIRSPWRQAP
jgi:hypothetical protein